MHPNTKGCAFHAFLFAVVLRLPVPSDGESVVEPEVGAAVVTRADEQVI
jgi:hypothetical protein